MTAKFRAESSRQLALLHGMPACRSCVLVNRTTKRRAEDDLDDRLLCCNYSEKTGSKSASSLNLRRSAIYLIIFIHQNGRNTYEEKKYSNYKITLTIGNRDI